MANENIIIVGKTGIVKFKDCVSILPDERSSQGQITLYAYFKDGGRCELKKYSDAINEVTTDIEKIVSAYIEGLPVVRIY